MKKKIVIGVTGASGSIYAQKLLQNLQTFGSEIEACGVVFSTNAETVIEHELHCKKHELTSFKIYDTSDFFAPFASGSGNYDCMIICPCTMGTIGRIAHGYADDLLTRAADVMLKEKKQLIIVAREMPYNLIHIENFKLLTLAGAVICPASPSFYSKPQSIDELVETVINKILHLAGFPVNAFEWGAEGG
ncbi:MAG: UbiX family flavin prenyltransferase [Bacteroidota bacterium]